MSFRSTSSAISRLNNCLSFFSGGSEDSKFTKTKLVEILEFSLPLEWRQKFDLDGYIPADGTMAQLILNGETIECNLDHKVFEKQEKKEKHHLQGKKAVKFAKTESKKELSTATYNCTFHGKNRSHNSENCFVLNKQKGSTQNTQNGKRTFTNKGLKHEINLLCQNAPKGKVLDQYLAVLHKEKAKLKKRDKKHKKSKTAAVPPQDSDT